MATGEERVGTEVGGRYRVVSLLGEGGFACVYRAVHLVTDKAVALKVLHPMVSQVVGMRERFLREMKLIGALNHPHIVGIHDAGFEPDGTGYAAFELLKGETLGELLARHRKLTPREIAPIACDVLRALSEAHKQEVIHRDIKPENIFLARDHNDRLVTKVLDFGIAYADTTADGGTKLTQTGMLLGSPTYMAPEQAAGDAVTRATDVWAVGVVLYEALAGDVPFNGVTAMDVLKQILWEKPTPVPDDIPRPLAAVIEKALSKPAAERYATADAMIAAIETALGTSLAPSIRPRVRHDLPKEPGYDASLDALIGDVYGVGKPSADPFADLTFTTSPPPSAPVPLVKIPPAPALSDVGSPRTYAVPEIKIQRAASVMHTSLTAEVVDRTRTRVRRRIAISVGGATIAIVATTAAILSEGYRVAHERASLESHTVPVVESPLPEPEVPAGDPHAGGRVPRPEINTPVSVAEQMRVSIPVGLSRVEAAQFVDHVVTPQPGSAPPSVAAAGHRHATATVGFASCAGESVYLHPGGVGGGLTSAADGVACDGPSLSFAGDVDGDHVSDLVAVNRAGNGLLVISSRGLSVTRRIALAGVRDVVGGLVLDRGEPGAVAYIPCAGGGGDLVAVGLRRGRVAWRSDPGLSVGDPMDVGLGVGPDVDGDQQPDVLVGTMIHGRRCVEVLSGVSGVRRWPGPVCSPGGSAQSLSLGPDTNEDGRGDVVVGNTSENRVRLLSGIDGSELRVLPDPDAVFFGVPAALVPDLGRDGFADIAVGHVGGDHPAVEVYSSNDGHRVGTWALPHGSSLPHVNVQYVEGMAFAGGRSLIVATPEGGVSVIGVGLRSERRSEEGTGP